MKYRNRLINIVEQIKKDSFNEGLTFWREMTLKIKSADEMVVQGEVILNVNNTNQVTKRDSATILGWPFVCVFRKVSEQFVVCIAQVSS